MLRGLGWDIDSPYSAPRGELFPLGSYGHTGFTGTSLWLDPASQTFVILLTNSVHVAPGRNINSIRAKVATIVAAALGQDREPVQSSKEPVLRTLARPLPTKPWKRPACAA